MDSRDFRTVLVQFIRTHAKPVDKFHHQPRLYALAKCLGQGQGPFDDDVLFAAAWLHDLGVFVGHRPEDLAALASWDHIAYATRQAPDILANAGFPSEKVPAVLETIRTHLPSTEPTSVEGVLLRDADLLEQLGAVGIMRTVSKVGRDTRFPTHGDAVRALRRSAEELPAKLKLAQARELAKPRLEVMKVFFEAVESEYGPEGL